MDFNSSTQRHLKEINKKFESRNVNGKDILEITTYQQLNLFILKKLYDKWIYNFNSNKIKYFNYESKDVIQTSKKLMNILSNNISIDINDFGSLFQESSNDLLELVRNPKKYIKEDLIVEEWYDEEKINKRSKYYYYHKKLFDMLIHEMKTKNEVSVKSREIVRYVDAITVDTNEELITDACNFFDCSRNQLLEVEENDSENYYKFFSMSKGDVDNLLSEAISKKNFEESMNHVLNNINKSYLNKFSSNDLREFFHKIKEKGSLSS